MRAKVSLFAVAESFLAIVNTKHLCRTPSALHPPQGVRFSEQEKTLACFIRESKPFIDHLAKRSFWGRTVLGKALAEDKDPYFDYSDWRGTSAKDGGWTPGAA